jgi:hypothetical protein
VHEEHHKVEAQRSGIRLTAPGDVVTIALRGDQGVKVAKCRSRSTGRLADREAREFRAC